MTGMGPPPSASAPGGEEEGDRWYDCWRCCWSSCWWWWPLLPRVAVAEEGDESVGVEAVY